MIIDAGYPLLFWGLIYLLAVAVNYWTLKEWTDWYLLMILFTPMNIMSGRVLNTWRRITKYDYKGYQ